MNSGPEKPFPHLFSPLRIGRRQARNRVFRAATATNLAEKFDVSDRLLAHYATLARGGAESEIGRQHLDAGDMQTAGGTPEDLQRFIAGEVAKWGPIIKSAGIAM